MASDHLNRVVKDLPGFSETAGRCHIFRHSLISLCAVSGVQKSQLQDWVGHLSGQMTEFYTHLSKQHADQEMNRVQLDVSPRG